MSGGAAARINPRRPFVSAVDDTWFVATGVPPRSRACVASAMAADVAMPMGSWGELARESSKSRRSSRHGAPAGAGP